MLYFLHGDSSPLMIKFEEIIEKIKKSHPQIPEKVFDLSTDDVSSFFDAISTNSIFSPRELIILKRAEKYKNLDEIIKFLKMYDLTQKEVVVIYEEILNDFGKISNPLTKKNLDGLGEIAKVICYRKENEKKTTVFFIQKELNISESEAENLLELVGDDFYKIKNEVEKIKNFLVGDVFTIEKVLPLINVSREYNLKNLIETFLISGKKDELLLFLEKEKLYTNFIYIISDELITYLKLIISRDSGYIEKNLSYKSFSEKAYDKIKSLFATDRGYSHPYTIFLKLKHLNLFDISFIREKLRALTDLEYSIKSGEIDMEIAVESFILGFYPLNDKM